MLRGDPGLTGAAPSPSPTSTMAFLGTRAAARSRTSRLRRAIDGALDQRDPSSRPSGRGARHGPPFAAAYPVRQPTSSRRTIPPPPPPVSTMRGGSPRPDGMRAKGWRAPRPRGRGLIRSAPDLLTLAAGGFPARHWPRSGSASPRASPRAPTTVARSRGGLSTSLLWAQHTAPAGDLRLLPVAVLPRRTHARNYTGSVEPPPTTFLLVGRPSPWRAIRRSGPISPRRPQALLAEDAPVAFLVTAGNGNVGLSQTARRLRAVGLGLLRDPRRSAGRGSRPVDRRSARRREPRGVSRRLLARPRRAGFVAVRAPPGRSRGLAPRRDERRADARRRRRAAGFVRNRPSALAGLRRNGSWASSRSTGASRR